MSVRNYFKCWSTGLCPAVSSPLLMVSILEKVASCCIRKLSENEEEREAELSDPPWGVLQFLLEILPCLPLGLWPERISWNKSFPPLSCFWSSSKQFRQWILTSYRIVLKHPKTYLITVFYVWLEPNITGDWVSLLGHWELHKTQGMKTD